MFRTLGRTRTDYDSSAVASRPAARGWSELGADTDAAMRMPSDPSACVTLLVHPDVIRVIGAAVAGAGDNETGGPLLGTVQRTWDGERFRPMVSLLGTLPPGPGVEGRPGSVGLGVSSDGERASSAIRWLREVTGLDLVHFGDWHRHPRGCPEPSPGDQRTAREMRALATESLWVIAIAVDDEFAEEDVAVCDNVATATGSRRNTLEVRFYEESLPAGLVPLKTRMESEVLPVLPPLPWHVAEPARFAAECRLLRAAGFSTAIVPAKPGACRGVTLRIEGADGRVFTADTGVCHPHEAPVVRDDRGRRVPTVGHWSSALFLVDLVREAS